ncbi:MAG: DPP IV N-terminal domain-containing protein, partial [Rubrivivax sp.]|nr:DPP IV N-terminal domain-containing protein [Pyrinomonadaceae bacterium]
MLHKKLVPLFVMLLLCWPVAAWAQGRLLTIDDIFDPVKKIEFGGSPPADLKWLNDGEHYLQGKKDAGVTRLMKVNARTGEAIPFFDAAKMEAALTKLPAISAADASRLARADSYKMNAAQTAVLLNFNLDLIYYELSGDTATRLTTDPMEESEEDFSPDGRAVSFVRGNDLYVIELATRRERRLTKTGGEKLLNGKLDWV